MLDLVTIYLEGVPLNERCWQVFYMNDKEIALVILQIAEKHTTGFSDLKSNLVAVCEVFKIAYQEVILK